MGFRLPKMPLSAIQSGYITGLLLATMCIAQVAIDLRKGNGNTLLLYSVLGILSFWVWIVSLIRHLRAIQRNQLWALSFLVGQALMGWAFYRGFSILAWILFGAIIIVQMPFALLSPPVQLGIRSPEGTSEPSA
jgi:hypothetical protein